MGWPAKEVDGARVDDSAALDNADAVLIFSDGGKGHPAIQGERAKVIDALEAKGVGLGFAHYARRSARRRAGRGDAALERRLLRDQLVGEPDVEAGVREVPESPDHARRQAVRDPRRVVLQHAVDRRTRRPKAKITPLLVATPSDEVRKGPYVSPRGPYEHIIAASGRDETMMWVYERPNGGRSFGFTGGHTHTNWGDPNQRKIMLNALLWIAKVDVPKNGVEDKIVEADLAQNLDDKRKR